MPTEEKIIVKPVSKPQKESIDEITSWFIKSFGFSEDENSTEAKLFREIVSKSLKGPGITSKELNEELDMPRSTLVYQINRFINSGLVIRKGRHYYLRATDMESTIEELQADMLREFNRMIEFAEKLDRIMMGDIHGRGEKGGSKTKRRK